MAQVYLSPEELHERWRGEVTLDTLKQWRSRRKGPTFIKLSGRGIVYPLFAVEEYENTYMRKENHGS